MSSFKFVSDSREIPRNVRWEPHEHFIKRLQTGEMTTDENNRWNGIRRVSKENSVVSTTPYFGGYKHGISIKRIQSVNLSLGVKKALNVTTNQKWAVIKMETYNRGYLFRSVKFTWKVTHSACKVYKRTGFRPMFGKKNIFIVETQIWSTTNPKWQKVGEIKEIPKKVKMTMKSHRNVDNEVYKSVIIVKENNEEKAVYFNSLADPSFKIHTPTRLHVIEEE